MGTINVTRPTSAFTVEAAVNSPDKTLQGCISIASWSYRRHGEIATHRRVVSASASNYPDQKEVRDRRAYMHVTPDCVTYSSSGPELVHTLTQCAQIARASRPRQLRYCAISHAAVGTVGQAGRGPEEVDTEQAQSEVERRRNSHSRRFVRSAPKAAPTLGAQAGRR